MTHAVTPGRTAGCGTADGFVGGARWHEGANLARQDRELLRRQAADQGGRPGQWGRGQRPVPSGMRRPGPDSRAVAAD
ncbi:hypothetical protein DVDV_2439 [Desulfovibrio sp. DV]|nr:hypothetical protein DVDV_2439 [Desulfovibrio sp. DV]